MELPHGDCSLLADLELREDYDVLKSFVMPGLDPGIHDLG
jgi:hypothetical protein